METRRELLDIYLRWRGALGDAEQRKLAADILNRALQNVWMAHPFADHLLPNPIEITTVANTRSYVMPQYFGRIPPRVKEVRNLTTAGRLSVWSPALLNEQRPASGTSLETPGNPSVVTIGAPLGVAVQPSASGQALEIVSDDADDVDIRVLVEGLDSNSQWNETQVTANGTTAVAIGTWKPPLIRYTKAYPAGTDPATEGTSSRGTMTLRVVSDASTLQVLLPEESGREFPSIILSPMPVSSGEIIGIPAIRAPKRLLYDADALPRFWSEALLEEMKYLWNVSTGDAMESPQIKPALTSLIALDNSQQRPPQTRPFYR